MCSPALPLPADDLVDGIEIIEGTLNGGGSTRNGAPRGVTYSSLTEPWHLRRDLEASRHSRSAAQDASDEILTDLRVANLWIAWRERNGAAWPFGLSPRSRGGEPGGFQ